MPCNDELSNSIVTSQAYESQQVTTCLQVEECEGHRYHVSSVPQHLNVFRTTASGLGVPAKQRFSTNVCAFANAVQNGRCCESSKCQDCGMCWDATWESMLFTM